MIMKQPYLALLRGINVGGKNMIRMSELKEGLEASGFEDIKTHIQSGNVLFSYEETDTSKLAEKISLSIAKHFKAQIGVAVFSKQEWQTILKHAPESWGKDKARKHNLLVMLKPCDTKQVTTDIGKLEPDIETLVPGEGVLYQSLSLKLFGRTTSGKLAGKQIYKQMTIRNYNTSLKLLSLFNDM